MYAFSLFSIYFDGRGSQVWPLNDEDQSVNFWINDLLLKAMPALLTSTSRPPYFSVKKSRAERTLSGSVMSSRWKSGPAPPSSDCPQLRFLDRHPELSGTRLRRNPCTLPARLRTRCLYFHQWPELLYCCSLLRCVFTGQETENKTIFRVINSSIINKITTLNAFGNSYLFYSTVIKSILFMAVFGVRRYLLRMRGGTRLHKALPFDVYVMCIKFCLLI